MVKEFIIVVKKSRNLDYILAPYVIICSEKPFYTIHERVTNTNLNNYRQLLSDSQKQLVKMIEEYNHQNLHKRFTNKNISVRDFIEELDKKYINNHIRPFIEQQISQVIDKLHDTETKLFFIGKDKNIYKTDEIIIQKGIAETIFQFNKDEDGTKYFQYISYQGKQIKMLGKEVLILSHKPCKIIIDNKLYQFEEKVDAKLLLPFFDKEYIFVPNKFEKKYYNSFIRNVIKNHRVNAEGFNIINKKSDIQAIISLENDLKNDPILLLSFIYDNQEIKSNYAFNKVVQFTIDNSIYQFNIIQRNIDFEIKTGKNLLTHGLINTEGAIYKLPNEENNDHKLLSLIQWINTNAKKLEKIKIGVRQNYFEQKYFTGQIVFSTDISKSNDWFDIHARVKFGKNFDIPFVILCSHIINGERKFSLPNGEIAILPEEWFEKYKDLALFSKRQKSSLQLRYYHYPILSGSGIKTNKNLLAEIESFYQHREFPVFEIPVKLNAVLRPYQEEGYKWLNYLAEKNLGACLADDMGLGKTIQSLAVLLRRKTLTKNEEQTIKTNLPEKQLNLFENEAGNTCHTSLIIMPASLIHNWIHEILKFTPDLKFCKYTGLNRGKIIKDFNHYDIVLTTYGIARNDVEELRLLFFDYLILDESQLIKNPGSKAYKAINQLNARNRVVLTGTPIENSLSDLWSQMNFIIKGLLGSYNFFREHFLIPIEKQYDEKRKKKLQDLIRPFIMRRTKQEVAKDLPPLIEEIYYCDMTDEQKDIYISEKNKIRNHVMENLQSEGIEKSAIMVLQALTKLRQMANHPALTDNNYKHSSGKFEEVCRNIETLLKEGHKVLVFSSFVKHLDIFSAYFKNNNWEFSLLTGSSTNRKEIIEKFKKTDSIQLFLISLKAGGVGLNLTEADYVFILEPWWNPAVEMQAISRAHRIKQNKNVFVYRFITKDSIEDKILLLQEKKSTLSNMFINSNNPLKGLTKKHIEELIS